MAALKAPGDDRKTTPLSIRDQIAVEAMKAILSREDTTASEMSGVEELYDTVARHAFGFADALLARRDK